MPRRGSATLTLNVAVSPVFAPVEVAARPCGVRSALRRTVNEPPETPLFASLISSIALAGSTTTFRVCVPAVDRWMPGEETVALAPDARITAVSPNRQVPSTRKRTTAFDALPGPLLATDAVKLTLWPSTACAGAVAELATRPSGLAAAV